MELMCCTHRHWNAAACFDNVPRAPSLLAICFLHSSGSTRYLLYQYSTLEWYLIHSKNIVIIEAAPRMHQAPTDCLHILHEYCPENYLLKIENNNIYFRRSGWPDHLQDLGGLARPFANDVLITC